MIVLQNNSNNTNQLLAPQSDDLIEMMKQEIAEEFGIELGANTSARDNGRVGGELTKRLVALGQQQLKNQNTLH